MQPVGVIIVSVLMGIAALELLRHSAETLFVAFVYGILPNLMLTPLTIGILGLSVAIKFALFCWSSSLASRSSTASALSGKDSGDRVSWVTRRDADRHVWLQQRTIGMIVF
jgi:divalent metal cation (Fe/Co/Zn/Cd) transporter